MEFVIQLLICIVLLLFHVKLIEFTLEQLSKILLILRFPQGPISLFFQVLGLSVPFVILAISFMLSGQEQFVAGTAVGYSILALLGVPALIGLRHVGPIRTIISSQSLASVLLGGFAFILVAIDSVINRPESIILIVLAITYGTTGFKVPATITQSHRAELSLGRIGGFLLLLLAVGGVTYYATSTLLQLSQEVPDSAILSMTLLSLLFVLPLLVFAWKNKQHVQTVIQAASHNAVIVLLGWVGVFGLITPLTITPYVLVIGLLFLFLSIFCFFLIGREVITLNRFTAVALACLIALYLIKIFFAST